MKKVVSHLAYTILSPHSRVLWPRAPSRNTAILQPKHGNWAICKKKCFWIFVFAGKELWAL